MEGDVSLKALLKEFLMRRQGGTWHDFAISFLLIVIVMLFIVLIYQLSIPKLLQNILSSLG
ncbi:MAG: hypothetical protein C0514_06765 [Candidatus Puniceispirillum sp.]|nr:hypothetical protein [Candidatus Puniceispirillum sp.]